MRIDKVAMVRATRRATVYRAVHGLSVARNARVEEDLVDQLFNSSETSGEGTLLTANFGKEGKPERVTTKD
jgi:CRP/FNR family transcriptional regulator, cyclic AMP receptor protein